MTNEERFWAKVDTSANVVRPELGHCWEWTGTTQDGYGVICFGGHHRAHRYAFALAYGPTDRLVCHRCDNRACVRPDHLFAGTQADNMKDMKDKGRRVGKEKSSRRVTPQVRSEIERLYSDGVSEIEIADRYGFTIPVVCKIIIRKYRS